jgi:hypothetical protein
MKMKTETQALHLARIMQKHIQKPSYELAFPLVMVPKKKLKKLSVDDLLLSGVDRLEFILIDGDTICANTQLKKFENSYKTEILNLLKDSVEQDNSKKYEILKFSFGTVQSKVLEPGHRIDITHIDLETVKLVLKDKTIAEGSLVIVDEEIAVQIKRVN